MSGETNVEHLDVDLSSDSESDDTTAPQSVEHSLPIESCKSAELFSRRKKIKKLFGVNIVEKELMQEDLNAVTRVPTKQWIGLVGLKEDCQDALVSLLLLFNEALFDVFLHWLYFIWLDFIGFSATHIMRYDDAIRSKLTQIISKQNA